MRWTPPGPIANDDIDRFLRKHLDDHEVNDRSKPRTRELLVGDIATDSTVIVYARVGEGGFGPLRLGVCVTSDLDQSQDSYATFQWAKYKTISGVRVKRTIGDSWATTTFGLTAFEPYEVLVNETLQEGETLVLEITLTGSASLSGLTVYGSEYRRQ